MVVILFFIFGAVCAFVFYWIGRAVRLNRDIANGDAMVNMQTGEVYESGSPEWYAAKESGAEGVRFV